MDIFKEKYRLKLASDSEAAREEERKRCLNAWQDALKENNYDEAARIFSYVKQKNISCASWFAPPSCFFLNDKLNNTNAKQKFPHDLLSDVIYYQFERGEMQSDSDLAAIQQCENLRTFIQTQLSVDIQNELCQSRLLVYVQDNPLFAKHIEIKRETKLTCAYLDRLARTLLDQHAIQSHIGTQMARYANTLRKSIDVWRGQPSNCIEDKLRLVHLTTAWQNYHDTLSHLLISISNKAGANRPQDIVKAYLDVLLTSWVRTLKFAENLSNISKLPITHESIMENKDGRWYIWGLPYLHSKAPDFTQYEANALTMSGLRQWLEFLNDQNIQNISASLVNSYEEQIASTSSACLRNFAQGLFELLSVGIIIKKITLPPNHDLENISRELMLMCLEPAVHYPSVCSGAGQEILYPAAQDNKPVTLVEVIKKAGFKYDFYDGKWLYFDAVVDHHTTKIKTFINAEPAIYGYRKISYQWLIKMDSTPDALRDEIHRIPLSVKKEQIANYGIPRRAIAVMMNDKSQPMQSEVLSNHLLEYPVGQAHQPITSHFDLFTAKKILAQKLVGSVDTMISALHYNDEVVAIKAWNQLSEIKKQTFIDKPYMKRVYLVHLVAAKGYAGLLKLISNRDPQSINIKDDWGLLPIHYAIILGAGNSLKTVTLLLEKSSAPPVDKIGDQQANIMHMAACFSSVEVLKKLISQKNCFTMAYEKLAGCRSLNAIECAMHFGKEENVLALYSTIAQSGCYDGLSPIAWLLKFKSDSIPTIAEMIDSQSPTEFVEPLYTEIRQYAERKHLSIDKFLPEKSIKFLIERARMLSPEQYIQVGKEVDKNYLIRYKNTSYAKKLQKLTVDFSGVTNPTSFITTLCATIEKADKIVSLRLEGTDQLETSSLNSVFNELEKNQHELESLELFGVNPDVIPLDVLERLLMRKSMSLKVLTLQDAPFTINHFSRIKQFFESGAVLKYLRIDASKLTEENLRTLSAWVDQLAYLYHFQCLNLRPSKDSFSFFNQNILLDQLVNSLDSSFRINLQNEIIDESLVKKIEYKTLLHKVNQIDLRGTLVSAQHFDQLIELILSESMQLLDTILVDRPRFLMSDEKYTLLQQFYKLQEAVYARQWKRGSIFDAIDIQDLFGNLLTNIAPVYKEQKLIQIFSCIFKMRKYTDNFINLNEILVKYSQSYAEKQAKLFFVKCLKTTLSEINTELNYFLSIHDTSGLQEIGALELIKRYFLSRINDLASGLNELVFIEYVINLQKRIGEAETVMNLKTLLEKSSHDQAYDRLDELHNNLAELFKMFLCGFQGNKYPADLLKIIFQRFLVLNKGVNFLFDSGGILGKDGRENEYLKLLKEFVKILEKTERQTNNRELQQKIYEFSDKTLRDWHDDLTNDLAELKHIIGESLEDLSSASLEWRDFSRSNEVDFLSTSSSRVINLWIQSASRLDLNKSLQSNPEDNLTILAFQRGYLNLCKLFYHNGAELFWREHESKLHNKYRTPLYIILCEQITEENDRRFAPLLRWIHQELSTQLSIPLESYQEDPLCAKLSAIINSQIANISKYISARFLIQERFKDIPEQQQKGMLDRIARWFLEVGKFFTKQPPQQRYLQVVTALYMMRFLQKTISIDCYVHQMQEFIDKARRDPAQHYRGEFFSHLAKFVSELNTFFVVPNGAFSTSERAVTYLTILQFKKPDPNLERHLLKASFALEMEKMNRRIIQLENQQASTRQSQFVSSNIHLIDASQPVSDDTHSNMHEESASTSPQSTLNPSRSTQHTSVDFNKALNSIYHNFHHSEEYQRLSSYNINFHSDGSAPTRLYPHMIHLYFDKDVTNQDRLLIAKWLVNKEERVESLSHRLTGELINKFPKGGLLPLEEELLLDQIREECLQNKPQESASSTLNTFI